MLFAMGAGDRLVGVGNYDRFPPEVDKLPRVGGLIDPDIERILSLKPDLVIVYDTQAELKQQLERAGVPFFSYEHRALPDIMETMRALGARIGAGAPKPAAWPRTWSGALDGRARVGRGPAPAEDAARLRAGTGHAARHQRERRLRIPRRPARPRRRRQRARRHQEAVGPDEHRDDPGAAPE